MSTDEAGASAPARRDAAALGNVIALATDAPMLDLLRGAVKDRHRLWRAEDFAQAAELLLAAPASVLLLDVAITGDETVRVVEQLREQFPGVPVIVSGRRDDEAALSSLISSGAVFRFLHKPLSEERARTFIDTAARRVVEQPPPPPKIVASPQPPAPEPAEPRPEPKPEPARRSRGPGRAAAIAGVLLLAAAAAALLHFAPWEKSSGRPSPFGGSASATGPAAATDPRIPGLLQAGELAVDDGRYAEPLGNNAIESYRAVLALDPGNEAALAGLARTADLLLVEAEFAMLDGNAAGAAAALDAARAASPGHPRIAEVSAQLAAERARLVAPSKPAAAPVTAPPPKETARDRVRDEAERRARFDRAMASAREAIAQGQTAQAGSWLARAADLAVDPPAVQRLRAQLEAVRIATEREERARLLALANQRIAQGRLTEPPADSAEHYLDLLRASDPDFAGVADTAALLGQRMLAEAKRLAAEGRRGDAEKMLASAAGFVAPEQLRAARESLGTAGRPAGAAGVKPESSLVRIAHSPPAYPERAAARGIEGWVDVEYTVGVDGVPRQARVVGANPQGVFDSAALEAIGRWRYQPPPGGEQRVGVRLRFNLGPG